MSICGNGSVRRGKNVNQRIHFKTNYINNNIMNYFNEQNEEVNKVLKTKDLGIFMVTIGNRPANPQHVRRLADSIRKHGILQNPIIVNEKMQVIDGQHRLLAAKDAGSEVYYIIVPGYKLEEVQVLNLNQKNWTKKDFMDGYADMGIVPYVKLRDFTSKNKDFNITDCIAMCQNSTSTAATSLSQKYRYKSKVMNQKEVFEEGTWIGKDFDLAQAWIDNLRMIKPLYAGYNRTVFIAAMIGMFKNDNFDFMEFLSKLKLQPQKLYDCSNVSQFKSLIEEIYNYRRREKVNLRF